MLLIGGGFGASPPCDISVGFASAHGCRDHSRQPRELLRAHTAPVRRLFRQLGLADCAQPIRAALRRSRVIEATVESVDLERQLVRAVGPEGGAYNRPYDHLVLAPGASTNDRLVPGSNALTIKTMADALVLRDHLIERSERADAARRCECLTVVVIGGWLVGVELIGELAAFADNVLPFYSRIRCDEACFGCSRPGRGSCQRSTRGWHLLPGRAAVLTPRWPIARSARRDTSWTRSGRSSTDGLERGVGHWYADRDQYVVQRDHASDVLARRAPAHGVDRFWISAASVVI
jgi:pyridine nucleotide-disulfide oxidoreductase